MERVDYWQVRFVLKTNAENTVKGSIPLHSATHIMMVMVFNVIIMTGKHVESDTIAIEDSLSEDIIWGLAACQRLVAVESARWC